MSKCPRVMRDDRAPYQQPRRQQQSIRPQMAGMTYAINSEQADIATNMVECTILVDNRPAIALVDPGSTHSLYM